MKAVIEHSQIELPRSLKTVLWAFVLLGAGMFVIGLATGSEEGITRTWQTLLINVMFWGGIAQAGVILSVIWQITDAKWGRPFKRLAEACAAFLPVAFVMFILVFFGSTVLYEWTHTPFMHHGVAVKAGWLNIEFFIIRNIFWLLLLYGISYWFVVTSIKPDLGLARRIMGSRWGGALADRLLDGYGDQEDEVTRLNQLSSRIAPALALLYAIGGSFLVWDFVMTLDQEWFSTLFGVFFLIGNLQATMGILIAIAVTVRNHSKVLAEYITINRLHDLTKLVFAFSLLWTYMAFSQYIVIWYADLPEETPYLVIRSQTEPWSTLFLILFLWLFVSVFLGLMPKTLCRTPNYIRFMGIYVAVGQWLAVYMMVVPSLQHFGHYHILLGFHELLITLGFGGAFFLCYVAFLEQVPLLPISDKHLCKSWHGH